MTSGAKLGGKALVAIGASPIAEITKATLKAGKDKVDVTNFDSAMWSEFIQGHKNWSVSLDCNYLLSDTNGQKALVDSWIADDDDAYIDDLTITDFLGGNAIAGTMFVTDMTIDFPLKDGQKFSVTLQGTEDLAIGT